jgi:hypothetical protein
VVLDSREHIRQEAEEQRDVFCHQLGHHCLTDTLYQNLQGRILRCEKQGHAHTLAAPSRSVINSC